MWIISRSSYYIYKQSEAQEYVSFSILDEWDFLSLVWDDIIFFWQNKGRS